MDRTIEAISARVRKMPSVSALIERYESTKKGKATALTTAREARREGAASAALAPIAGAALGGVADAVIPMSLGPVSARTALGLALTVVGWQNSDSMLAGLGSGMLAPEAYRAGATAGTMFAPPATSPTTAP